MLTAAPMGVKMRLRRGRMEASTNATRPDEWVTPDRLTYLVKQLQEVLRVRLGEITQRYGLTPKQYTALSVLAKYPGMSSAALARVSFVTPQAANEMVTLLEGKGFLSRSVDQRNRRCLEVELTRVGSKTLAKCDALVAQLEAEVFEGVSTAEQVRFRRTLRSCVQAAGRAPSP
jgi:DNA-binding MarR family transcriptional regulator